MTADRDFDRACEVLLNDVQDTNAIQDADAC